MRTTKRFMSFVLVFAMLMTSLSCLGGVFSVTASATAPTITNLDGITREPGQHRGLDINGNPRTAPLMKSELAAMYPDGYSYLSGWTYEIDTSGGYTPNYDFQNHMTETDGYVHAGDYVVLLIKFTTSYPYMGNLTGWFAHTYDFFDNINTANDGLTDLTIKDLDESNTNLETYGCIMNPLQADVANASIGLTFAPKTPAVTANNQTNITKSGWTEDELDTIGVNVYVGSRVGSTIYYQNEDDLWSLAIMYKVKDNLQDGAIGSIFIPATQDPDKGMFKVPVSGMTPLQAGKKSGTLAVSTTGKKAVNSHEVPHFDYQDFGVTLCVGDPPAEGDTYTVTFYDADGNTVLDTIDDLAAGATVALADAPSVTPPAGQNFAGWVDAQGNAVSWPITVSGDTAVYASYAAATYTLTINYQYANGTTAAATHTSTYAYNDSYSVVSPVIDGYTADILTVAGTITDDTTETVTYTANTYTATFYDSDGTTVLGTTQAQYGANIQALSPQPTMDGATFLGWSTTPGGNVTNNLGTMPIGGKSFYAKWQVATVFIDFFEMDCATYIDGFDVPVGTDISTVAPTPTAPVAGQQFIGWFVLDESYNFTDEQITIVPNEEYLVVAAKFADATYTVTFNDENGNLITTQSGSAGTTITAPSVTVPAGYSLSWVDENNNPMPATIEGDATYHVVFTPIEYTLTVTYETSDGSVAPADETYQVAYGTNYDYPVTVPAGYTADVTTVSGTMPAAATTVTVTLTPVSYPLTIHYYYANTTTSVFPDDVVNVLYNASYTVTPPTYYGYSYSIAPATSVQVTMDQIGGKEYTVFYGTNDVKVNIDYVYANGTTAAPSVQLINEFGVSYSQVSPPITGYTPDIPVVFGTFTVDTTIDPIPTITVTYTANAHTVTWALDGGNIAGDEGPIVQNTEFGAPIVAPGTPEKSGFTFNGWTPAPASTVPDEDVTYTAIWEASGDTPYSVTVYTMGTDGAYDSGITTAKTGVTGAPVDAASAALEAGFYYDVDHAGYAATGVIAADGSTALTVYVGRSQYALTFSIDGNDTVTQVYYGAAISAPAAAKEGYDFTGWSPEVPATMPAADSTYTAQFEINTYPVEWTIDGASQITDVTFGEVPVAPEAAKEGHTFAGWFVTGDSTETIVTSFPAVGVDGAAYTAKFTINQYTLTFIVNGETYQVITQDYGTQVTPPADPTMEGNDFSCWKVDGVSTDVPETMPAQDMTFVAAFGLATFNFTYVIDGASTTIAYEYGETVAAIPNPSKTGYTFTGWDPEWPATMPAGDLTVTAQFEINTYKVIASIDGNTVEYEFEYGENVVIDDPVKTGYTFSYWTPSLPSTMPANDFTTTAVFAINKYQVTWTVDGSDTTAMVNYGAVPAAPSAAKEGYTFVGWFVTGDATETVLVSIPAMDENGAAYTAKFEINTYTATFALNGGNIDGNTADVVLNVEFGGAITAPADPERSGYVFAGWSPEVDATIGAGNVTYTAQWTQDTSYCTVKSVVRLGDDPYYECGVANWAITVEGTPSRLQIYYDDTYSVGWDYSRFNPTVLDDGDLTGLVSIVDNGDGTEVWTVRATIPEGGYKARAKVAYDESSWELLENGFDFTVEYDETVSVSAIISVAVDKTEIKRGDSVTFTIVATSDINMIRLADVVDNGSTVSSSIGFTKASVGEGWVDNGDGTATWTVSFPISYVLDIQNPKLSELNTYTAYYYDEASSEFIDGGVDSVSVNVTRYDTSGEIHEVDGNEVDPYSILDATAALGKKLSYTNITITTTSDVSKIRLTVGTKQAVYTRTSNNVTFTDNGDGTATWVIGYRFTAAGEYTVTVESRGNTWVDCSSTTVTTTIYNNNAELAAAQG